MRWKIEKIVRIGERPLYMVAKLDGQFWYWPAFAYSLEKAIEFARAPQHYERDHASNAS